MAVFPDEDFRGSARAGCSLAANFRLDQEAAPHDRYVAEVLHLSARKFKPH